MKKTILIVIAAVIIVSVWSGQWAEEPSVTSPESPSPAGTVKDGMQSSNTTVDVEETIVSTPSSEKDLASSTTTPEGAKPPKANHATQTVDYADDWCVYSQLSEKDRDYANEELLDWEISVGRLAYNVPTESGYQMNDESYQTDAYVEIPLSDLRAHINNEKPMAMFAALDRYDIEAQEQLNIAKS